MQALGLVTHRIDLSENRPKRANNIRLTVRSVEPAGLADVVYCFNESLAHRGCFNGVLTAQCGEQPLPPYGACLLGSFNLVKYLRQNDAAVWDFDWEQFRRDIPPVVRAMDNVVDRAKYPLYEQKKEAKAKRRMGLGVTGLANCVEALGFAYGSPAFLQAEEDLLSCLRDECYRASTNLAAEKGSFPMFDPQQYLSGQFIKSLPEDIRDGIARYGIRNSHLTSIAPTGTISLTADNVSSGIEPVFNYKFNRDIRTADGPRIEEVEDYGVRVLGVRGKRSADVSLQEHLEVLAIASQNVDSAVSKTCNVPGDTSWDDFKRVYTEAWERGCKGCTTFRTDGRRLGILTVSDDDAGASETDPVVHTEENGGSTCYIDWTTGRHECE